MTAHGTVLVFIGPSGSGKSTAVRALRQDGVIEVTPSWTTRPRRHDEAGDTVEHRFVSDEDLSALEASGFFLEVVRPFGLPYRYGLPRPGLPPPGRVPAIMVRAPLLALVARHFPHHLTYQIEDSYERARNRVVATGGTDAPLGTRLEGYEEERRLGRMLANRVFVNAGTPTELVTAVADALRCDFSRLEQGL